MIYQIETRQAGSDLWRKHPSTFSHKERAETVMREHDDILQSYGILRDFRVTKREGSILPWKV